MSDNIVIKYCAPTLAGLKVGNLFSYKIENIMQFAKSIVSLKKILVLKGLNIVVLNIKNNVALIYIYRVKMLKHILSDNNIKEFLTIYGYKSFTIDECIKVLKVHLKNESFPHEIGVFLGYPLHDIEGFISNKGKNCECVGCWKAYHKIEEAKKVFKKYNKCTSIYCNNAKKGFKVVNLTVAS